MRARTLALILGAALIAIGGIYLFIDVRSATTGPSSDVLEQARQRHLRSTSSGATSAATSEHDSDERRPHRELVPANDAVFAKDNEGHPRARGALIPGPQLPPIRGSKFRRGGDTPPTDGVNEPDLDSALLEANKAYDRKDFETARALALALLQKRVPGNIRMLRVVVSSSCILGDAEVAKKYATELPAFDRDQMTSRCAQYGITVQ